MEFENWLILSILVYLYSTLLNIVETGQCYVIFILKGQKMCDFYLLWQYYTFFNYDITLIMFDFQYS